MTLCGGQRDAPTDVVVGVYQTRREDVHSSGWLCGRGTSPTAAQGTPEGEQAGADHTEGDYDKGVRRGYWWVAGAPQGERADTRDDGEDQPREHEHRLAGEQCERIRVPVPRRLRVLHGARPHNG